MAPSQVTTLKMMDFAFKMMNFAFKMMNLGLQMMNIARLHPPQGRNAQ